MTQAANAPHCGTNVYGGDKTGTSSVTLHPTPSPAPADYGPDGILHLDHRLGVPPEITRVRRGLTSHYVGGFINDGLEGWQAVDLDARTVVRVGRRYSNRRAQLSRPFSDPVLPAWAIKATSPSLRARKWSDDESVSEEVVNTVPLPADAEEAFVCAANPAWAAAPKAGPRAMPTDTLVSSVTLLDFDASLGKQDAKDVSSGGALGWVTLHLPEPLKYEWPLGPRL